MRLALRIRLVAALMVGGTVVLSAQPAVSQEVKLNEVLRSLFYAPQYVALRSGAFEQEGLKVVGPKTTWGVQAALTEVVSGNSNIALMGPEAAGLTQEASPDRRLVNFALLTNGGYWTDTHSAAEIAALIAPDFKDVPVATIETVIAEYKKVKIWATDPLLSREGMDQMMGLMVDGGILKQRFPYTQLVDPSFAQKAIQTIKR